MTRTMSSVSTATSRAAEHSAQERRTNARFGWTVTAAAFSVVIAVLLVGDTPAPQMRGEEMNADLLKIVIGGVVGAHGIGHVLGWMPAWGIAKFEGMSSHSWLLTGLVGDGAARFVGGALWFVPMVGFLAATAGFFLGQAWWRPLGVGSAAISLVALVLFFEALPVSSRVGCVAVDLAVLYGVLIANWPSASAVGA